MFKLQEALLSLHYITWLFLIVLSQFHFQYAELTPNKTRRAQCANWLLYYREELFGYSIDELKERRRKKHEGEDRDRLRKLHELTTNEDTKGNAMGKGDTEWKPPVREVF